MACGCLQQAKTGLKKTFSTRHSDKTQFFRIVNFVRGNYVITHKVSLTRKRSLESDELCIIPPREIVFILAIRVVKSRIRGRAIYKDQEGWISIKSMNEWGWVWAEPTEDALAENNIGLSLHDSKRVDTTWERKENWQHLHLDVDHVHGNKNFIAYERGSIRAATFSKLDDLALPSPCPSFDDFNISISVTPSPAPIAPFTVSISSKQEEKSIKEKKSNMVCDGKVHEGSYVKFTHEDHGVDLTGVVWSKNESELAEVVILDSYKALQLQCSGQVLSIPLNDLEVLDDNASQKATISVV